MKKPEMTKAAEEALVKAAKDDFDADLKVWQPIMDEGDEDMKNIALDPWEPEDRTARDASGRPCIVTDELGQYVNQPINEFRANPRGVKFNPTGNGANDKTARIYENKMREIEYRSVAQQAYSTAYADALQRSFGWARVDMRFVSPRSFKKELWIEAIPNPNSVLPDRNFMKPDASDMKRCFVWDTISVADFVREYPWAEVRSFSSEIIQGSNGWVKDNDLLRIAERWLIETKERTLCLYQNGPQTAEAFSDEGQQYKPGQGWKKVHERRVDFPSVVQYLTNGVEILKKTPWQGKTIPIRGCFGKILWLNDNGTTRRVILSMVRAMRSPYMAMCWTLSNEVEALGMITKNPYWGYEGQMSPAMLEEVKKSIHEPVAMLLAKPYLDGMNGGTPLPLPIRNPLTADLTAYAMSAEQWRRAIQSAAGSNFLPTNAQKRNDKSGVALEKIDEQAQKGTYHFTDAVNGMIRGIGEIIEDVLESAVDVSRELVVVEPDGKSKTIKLAAKGEEPSSDEEFSVKGDHAVTISVGPSYESEREAASEFADLLAQQKEIFPLIGPLVVKLKNLGPIGDEIAKALETLQPPELRKQEDGAKPDPAMLQAQLQKATQLIEMAKAEIAERDKIIETKQLERQTELQKAEHDGMVRIEIAKIQAGNRAETTQAQVQGKARDTDVNAEVKLQIAQMQARIDAAELKLKAMQMEHDAEEAEKSRQHEEEMAEYGVKTQAVLGEREHERGMESQTQAERAAEKQAKAKPKPNGASA